MRCAYIRLYVLAIGVRDRLSVRFDVLGFGCWVRCYVVLEAWVMCLG